MNLLISGYGVSAPRSTALIQTDGKISRTVWEDNIDAASYAAFSDGLLFVISEWEQGSAIRLLKWESGAFHFRDEIRVPGGSLCHITYLPGQKVLLGACYGSGEVFSIAVDPEAVVFGKILTYQKQGKGEECSFGHTRAHMIRANAQETIAISTNIALDRLYLYRINEGKLEDESYFQLPKGIGPRHFVWREDINKIYVVTEYSNEIILLNAEKSGVLLLERYLTLQDDFEGESYGSTLVFSADGKELYAGNRGEDTIVHFHVSSDGSLSKAGSYSCGGCWPRDLALVDHDQFLAVANQKTNTVQLLPRNSYTGALGTSAMTIPLAGASFVSEINAQEE